MSLLDVGLNKVSLAALIISLGLLVDNAIVMVESIQVQISEGKGAVESAIDTAGELRCRPGRRRTPRYAAGREQSM